MRKKLPTIFCITFNYLIEGCLKTPPLWWDQRTPLNSMSREYLNLYDDDLEEGYKCRLFINYGYFLQYSIGTGKKIPLETIPQKKITYLFMLN
jgi:hypothetical protein